MSRNKDTEPLSFTLAKSEKSHLITFQRSRATLLRQIPRLFYVVVVFFCSSVSCQVQCTYGTDCYSGLSGEFQLWIYSSQLSATSRTRKFGGSEKVRTIKQCQQHRAAEECPEHANHLQTNPVETERCLCEVCLLPFDA